MPPQVPLGETLGALVAYVFSRAGEAKVREENKRTDTAEKVEGESIAISVLCGQN